MAHSTEPRIVLLPSDVDDPSGYGVSEYFDSHGIHRDDPRADRLAEILRTAYANAVARDLTAAGFQVIRTGPIGSPECHDDERRYAEQLAEYDSGLPIDTAEQWTEAVAAADLVLQSMPSCDLALTQIVDGILSGEVYAWPKSEDSSAPLLPCDDLPGALRMYCDFLAEGDNPPEFIRCVDLSGGGYLLTLQRADGSRATFRAELVKR